MAATDESLRNATGTAPEELTGCAQIRSLIETAIDTLPEPFRCAFMLRAVEQMAIAETAHCLDLPPTIVKTPASRASAATAEARQRGRKRLRTSLNLEGHAALHRDPGSGACAR